MLISRCLTSRPTIKQIALREQVIARLFQVLLQTSDSSLRQALAANLVDVGGKEVNTTLLKLLASNKTSVAVRQCIVYALYRQGKEFATQHLLNLASNSATDQNVRQVIAYGLSRLGERLSTTTLLQILFDAQDQDDIVLQGIMSTLIEREGRLLIPELQQRLSNQHISIEPHVRTRVESFLSKLQSL